MKTTLRSLGALTAALVLAGCGTMSVNPVVQYLDDTGTTTAIKTRLAREAGVGRLTSVGVQTKDDMVRLTGTVADDAERLHVERIARSVAGDNRVISELQVASSVSASPTTPQPTAAKAPSTPAAPIKPAGTAAPKPAGVQKTTTQKPTVHNQR